MAARHHCRLWLVRRQSVWLLRLALLVSTVLLMIVFMALTELEKQSLRHKDLNIQRNLNTRLEVKDHQSKENILFVKNRMLLLQKIELLNRQIQHLSDKQSSIRNNSSGIKRRSDIEFGNHKESVHGYIHESKNQQQGITRVQEKVSATNMTVELKTGIKRSRMDKQRKYMINKQGEEENVLMFRDHQKELKVNFTREKINVPKARFNKSNKTPININAGDKNSREWSIHNANPNKKTVPIGKRIDRKQSHNLNISEKLPSQKLADRNKYLLNKTFTTKLPDLYVTPTTAYEHVEMLESGNELMIMSYMRSGSSMNGKVFMDGEGEFFVYEPLIKFAPYDYLTESRMCTMRKLKCRKSDLHGSPVVDSVKSTLKALKTLYSCNIRGLDDRILRSIMFENLSGKIWSNFTQCYINVTEKKPVKDLAQYLLDAKGYKFDKHENVFRFFQQPGPLAEKMISCLTELETKCRTAKFRTTKVLRLSLRLVPRLLKNFPRLKILFIIRDPRGIVNSRIQTHWFPVSDDKPTEVLNNIKSLCYKMEGDIIMLEHLKRNFPGRILDFRLEDITQHPLDSYEKIFKLLNVPLTNAYREKIMGIFVSRPKFQSKWVVSLKEKYIRQTEQYCAKVFKTYLYSTIYY